MLMATTPGLSALDDAVPEPIAATKCPVDLVDSQVEANTGEGVAARNNDSPTV
jgi:hypothetical protein